ncbi:hypothetical protein CSE16_10380 [Solibacillus sp. R5-41]|uniref:YrvL family regulatory protein n=1 Tax=Solibacillus sp. R5-41 TaxID=2048654 RepID=UPI000C127027|nr:YrvL family regulatory protein [Solibacillus sp. R5-41]ATP40423.1 hypothetical protein CSE16_10380 [Solibacillus sp. R5-41]
MNKLSNIFGILIAVLAFIAIIGVVIAAEVFALILVGFTYESWKSFAIFIIVFGIVEFILSSIMQRFVQTKAKSNHMYHKFWGHLLISITLMLIAVNVMESISIPVFGAIIYAVITAILYLIVDIIEQKNPRDPHEK